MSESEFEGRVVVITGGAGVLCSAMARALAQRGARIAILQRRLEVAETLAARLRAEGGSALAVSVDVLDRQAVEAAAERVLAEYGRVDALINGAGGNRTEATTSAERTFFDLPAEAVRSVFDLNLLGTIIPSQVFGRQMVAQGKGAILNVASMSSYRPLTRTMAYSAAKAGIVNFTQWLAVHLSQEYSPNIRVNAIAPGFFLTDQNRYLLTDRETGELTPRGRAILAHTPQGRFGTPEDLVGAVLWLLSDSASFVHGAVIPIDGGFSAFSGV
ncbi:MAG: SDR family oxidoreductase [Chloroflexi bacterium]|nr:SDR family oxidoreductase [Chloroflexota bacterium]